MLRVQGTGPAIMNYVWQEPGKPCYGVLKTGRQIPQLPVYIGCAALQEAGSPQSHKRLPKVRIQEANSEPAFSAPAILTIGATYAL